MNPTTLPSELRFDDRFVRALPGDQGPPHHPREVMGAAWSAVTPTHVPAPRLVAVSDEVVDLLGLSPEWVHTETFARVFAGNELLPGMRPYSANYGGHQFGNWAGQLGDGRAITLGELIAPDAARYELQLKGAGPTPYSRRADGRAVLRSSVREFLCSEAMAHLGVPTTRALSLVTTGEGVLRDMFYDGRPAQEPGAVVCRVAPSFLRFGNFEIFAHRGEKALLSSLVDFTLQTHFPSLGPLSPTAIEGLLTEVAVRSARLVIGWQRVGFVHGVLNTDNLSLLGLTLDYGPYGWLEGFDPDWTPNTTDAGRRRYRFGQQPAVVGWNLARLAEALYPLIGEVAPLERALSRYQEELRSEDRQMWLSKLGLLAWREDRDPDLVRELVAILSLVETDYTIFFRALARLDPSASSDEALLEPLNDAFYVPADGPTLQRIADWVRSWEARAHEESPDREARSARMDQVNPRYVLRNWLAQLAIDRAAAHDPKGVSELLSVLRHPYDEQPGKEAFAQRRPEWARVRAGCSMLSCSS